MNKNGPIIKSLADTDRYKFNMMQVVYHKFPGAEVEYHYKCRTPGVNLVPFMAEIEEELEAYCSLRFSDEELGVIASPRYVKKDFVEFLELYQPRMKHVRVIRSETDAGEIDVVVKGPWLFTILFEIPILAIISEVYTRNTYDVKELVAQGKDRLMNYSHQASR